MKPTSAEGIHESATVYERVDVALEDLVRRARREHGVRIPCTKGCDACCYDVVCVSSMEAKVLEAAVLKLPPAKQRLVRDRMNAWLSRASAAGIDVRDARPDLRTYHRARLACPLLDPGSRACMVYEARPIACRTHFLVNQKPRVCAERATRPIIRTLLLGDLIARATLLLVRVWHKTLEDPTFRYGLLVPVLHEVWINGAPPVTSAPPAAETVAP